MFKDRIFCQNCKHSFKTTSNDNKVGHIICPKCQFILLRKKSIVLGFLEDISEGVFVISGIIVMVLSGVYCYYPLFGEDNALLIILFSVVTGAVFYKAFDWLFDCIISKITIKAIPPEN